MFTLKIGIEFIVKPCFTDTLLLQIGEWTTENCLGKLGSLPSLNIVINGSLLCIVLAVALLTEFGVILYVKNEEERLIRKSKHLEVS